MPEPFTMTAVLVIFYTVFLAQILFLSVYIPGRVIKRANYILDQFPPKDYPKLYPVGGKAFSVDKSRRSLRYYRILNFAIALLGIVVLQMMISSGYRPRLEGGDEIYVLFYFFLQIAPILYAELKEYRHYKLMQEFYEAKHQRSAEMAPRRLFDFVSPVSVLFAAVSFVVWMTVYLSSRNFETQPSWEIYVTVFVSVGMQLMFAGIIARHLYGKKSNPYQSYPDQLRQIGAVAKTLVMASIGMSVFLTISQLVDQYSLEVFDPVISSIYFQFCAAAGIVFAFNTIKVEKVDFEVYKGD